MKTVIEMAREVGLSITTAYGEKPALERFAELVRADAIAKEREACAKVCEYAAGTGKIISCTSAAAAIRARGNT